MPFILGLVLPDYFWGTHSFVFLPPVLKFGGIALLLSVFYLKIDFPKIDLYKFHFLLISILFACFFYFFSIPDDNYGDAFQLKSFNNRIMAKAPWETKEWGSFLSIPSMGRKFTLNFVNIVSYFTQLHFKAVFQWLGVLFGAGFVYIWLNFINDISRGKKQQLIFSLVFLLAPFTLVFYGHIETYAPVYFLISLYLINLCRAVLLKTSRNLWISGVLIFILPLFHPISILLTPLFLFVIICNKRKKVNLNWSIFLKWIYIPFFLAGCILYFFVFEDYNDPRVLKNIRDIDRLFLPLISPEAPLDRYNIFSWQHLFDLGNLLFYWSSTSLIVLAIAIVKRKQIDFNDPLIFIGGSGTLLMFSFLFPLNPLLTLPMDWDLFSIPSVFFAIFSIGILRQFQLGQTMNKVIFISIIFGSMSIIVNLIPSSHALRLESIGIWNFKSYHIRSNINLIYSAGLQSAPNFNDYLTIKERQENKIIDLAIIGKDDMYAALLFDDGVYCLNQQNNLRLAKSKFKMAIEYYPDFNQAKLFLMNVYEGLNEYESAFLIARELQELGFPSLKEAEENLKRLNVLTQE